MLWVARSFELLNQSFYFTASSFLLSKMKYFKGLKGIRIEAPGNGQIRRHFEYVSEKIVADSSINKSFRKQFKNL